MNKHVSIFNGQWLLHLKRGNVGSMNVGCNRERFGSIFYYMEGVYNFLIILNLKGSKKLLKKLRQNFSLVVKHTAPEVEAFKYLGSRCNKRITGLFTQILSNQSVIRPNIRSRR